MNSTHTWWVNRGSPPVCKDGSTLNGDVGRIWTNHSRKGILDKGMAMVDTVHSSDVLVTGSLSDRAIGDVLLSE